MKQPEILVISREAQAYARLLEGLPLMAVTDPQAAVRAYSGQQVVLGEPDRVAAALPELDRVLWVQSTWAGVKPLIQGSGTGPVITGVKDVFGAQMAEYVIGYMLARELDVLGRHAAQRAGAWDDSDTGGITGKTLGIMGTGSIGSYIAGRAAGLGMRVTGFSRSGRPVPGFEAVYRADRLTAFLRDVDYLAAVLPDTPATTDLLDAGAFRAMRRHACLINVGRGNVVDETALHEALVAGELAGAVLDVFKQEPLPPDHPFWTTPNLLFTAHVAARSYPDQIADIFRENYRRYVAGKSLKYVIDPARGY